MARPALLTPCDLHITNVALPGGRKSQVVLRLFKTARHLGLSGRKRFEMSFNKAELFPDKYLNLANRYKYVPPGTILVVTALTVEAIGETRTPKPLLAFAGLDQRLVLSKGRYETMETLFGQDADDWPGNAITLAIGTVRGAATITIAAARPAQKVAAAS